MLKIEFLTFLTTINGEYLRVHLLLLFERLVFQQLRATFSFADLFERQLWLFPKTHQIDHLGANDFASQLKVNQKMKKMFTQN